MRMTTHDRQLSEVLVERGDDLTGTVRAGEDRLVTGVTNPVDHAFDFVPGSCQCSGG
jgi:hypothetical protein